MDNFIFLLNQIDNLSGQLRNKTLHGPLRNRALAPALRRVEPALRDPRVRAHGRRLRNRLDHDPATLDGHPDMGSDPERERAVPHHGHGQVEDDPSGHVLEKAAEPFSDNGSTKMANLHGNM